MINLTKDEPVVILAGGKGLRMREHTEVLPKALVPIGPYPVILHVMNIFANYGYKKFILCLGYKGEDIKKYFMDHEWMSHDFILKMGPSNKKIIQNLGSDLLDFEITFANTGEETQTGGRVKKIQKYVDTENFFVTYSDGLTNIDIEDLMAFHKKKNKIGTVSAVHTMTTFGIVDVGQDETVSSFREKPSLPGYINGGFMVFKKNFFDYLDEECILEQKPMKTLAKEGQLVAYRHEDFWACMDTFKDVERLNTLWYKKYFPDTSFEGEPPWIKRNSL
jgi:glucose-1-phosphate cytidylyltransferase